MEWEYFKDQVGEIKASLECIFNKIDDLNKLVGKQGENIAIIRTEIGIATNTGIILRLKILEDKVEAMQKSLIEGMKEKIKYNKTKQPGWQKAIIVVCCLVSLISLSLVVVDRIEKRGADKALIQQAIATTPNPTP